MASKTFELGSGFRKFRRIVLAFASILSLIWTIIISVYIANNWSGYNSGERGFLFGLIALDFIGSILLYLMIVVQYQFWPDAARTMILLSLNVAGAVVFLILSPKFPCSAFGSTAKCHNMTLTVLIGSWIISALILLYAICLPFVAITPRTPNPIQADDLEDRADVAEATEVSDDLHRSHVSSVLLKNQEGMSPEAFGSELPSPPYIPAAHEVPSNALPQQATGDDHIESETPSAASVYSDASRSSVAGTIRAPDDADRSLNVSGSSSPRQYPRYSDSLELSALPNRFVGETLDASRNSVASSVYGSTYEFPTASVPLTEASHRTPSVITGSSTSMYSQRTIPARAKTVSPVNATTRQTSLLASRSMSYAPPHLSVRSMSASVHDHAEHQAAGGSNEPTFELHLSDAPRRDSEDKLSDLPRDVVQDPVRHPRVVRPSLQHLRADSTSSNIDPDVWRSLVLSAAGRQQ
ncbi:hypothetical protein DFJ58DRAFT_753089 [Suillus subalutaceus]|uniref:uncharacterized protein n=1 Tax=Suillus subalutaceus TaxID=48586 RepID=UPI001B8808C0|nr:uncharacterized protein DFJ58DRAFT_753089 [Suillus subalutaceus]KAG1877881.1 hypothetical protein DFJ58DRAFT_753089 [Suillus subalutaceus]